MIKVLGITDTVCTCDCCGRTDLKRTVILSSFEGDSIRHLGVSCASRAMGRKDVLKLALDAQCQAEQEQKRQAKRQKLLDMSRADFGTK